MLSRSGFNRRLHRIANLILTLLLRLGAEGKSLNKRLAHVIDSSPGAVCDNDRIPRGPLTAGFS